MLCADFYPLKWRLFFKLPFSAVSPPTASCLIREIYTEKCAQLRCFIMIIYRAVSSIVLIMVNVTSTFRRLPMSGSEILISCKVSTFDWILRFSEIEYLRVVVVARWKERKKSLKWKCSVGGVLIGFPTRLIANLDAAFFGWIFE